MPTTTTLPACDVAGRFTQDLALWPGRYDSLVVVGNDAAGAVFNADRTHRYLLWRTWDHTKPYLLVCGLNPSYADENRLDATCTRCEKRARAMGFGGYVMVNLFSLKSTDPRKLFGYVTGQGEEPPTGGYLNDMAIMLAARHAGQVIVAWGTLGSLYGRDREMEFLLRSEQIDLYCLGTTRDGRPRHPSRLGYDVQPQPYTPSWPA